MYLRETRRPTRPTERTENKSHQPRRAYDTLGTYPPVSRRRTVVVWYCSTVELPSKWVHQNVGPASVHTRRYRIVASRGVPSVGSTFNLHNNGCVLCSLSPLNCVCASLCTRAPGIFATALGEHISPSDRYLATWSDAGMTTYYAVISDASATFWQAERQAQVCFLGQHKVTSPFCNCSDTQTLHTPPVSLVAVCDPLYSTWHGSWSMAQCTHGAGSLQLAKGKNRVESQFPTTT
jgi:hypothetical protein